MKHFVLPLAAAILALLLVLQLRPDPDELPGTYRETVGSRNGGPPEIAVSDPTDPELDRERAEQERLEQSSLAPLAPPTAVLTVLVRRQDGRPLPDVEVIVGPRVVVDARLDDRTEETDANGSATFRLPPGDWRVRCSLSGIKDAVEQQLVADGTRTVELVLPANPTVHGLVRDESGAPIAGARVLLLGLHSASIARLGARSDATGAFELPGISAGRQIAATAEGFAPTPPRRIPLADPLAPTITLVLSRDHGFVQGVVTDANEKPLPSALVWFGPVGAGSQNARTGAPAQVLRCDENGRFRSPPLALGEIEVRALAPGFALARTTARVEPGAATELAVRLDPGARVTGTVRRADGTPVDGAYVYVGVLRAMGCRLAFTDADGNFAIECVPTGGIELTARSVDLEKQPWLARTSLHLSPGEEGVWHAQLEPEVRRSVRGSVQDQNGRPLVGWLVRAVPRGSRSALGAETGADGAFTIDDLSSGTHADVTVRNPTAGWSSFADATLEAVEIDGPAVVITVQQPASDRGTLLGTVVDDDAKPLAATVHLRHENGTIAHYATRLDGTFRIDNAPAGRLQVKVLHEDFPSLSPGESTVLAGGTVDLGTLQLRRGGLVFGRVTRTDEHPLQHATLRLIDDSDREVAFADCSDGGFRTPWLVAGRYDLLIQADEAAPRRVAVQVLAGQERELDIRLDPGLLHRFRVRTRDPADQDRQCSVVVFDQERRAIWVAHLPMTQGVAEFRASLPPGRLEVLALGVRNARATASFAVEPNGQNGPGLTELELVR